MADVAANDTGVTPPPAIATTLPTTTTTSTDVAAAAASPDSAAAAAAAASNRTARRKTARSPSGSTGGHYADPLSPIASTPLKRQRVQTAEKASKATPSHGGASSSVKKTPKSDAPSTAADAFLSPRKLVHEYDADEKPARQDDTVATHGRASPERQTSRDGDVPSGDDELFSPVLKPPRATRTSSDTSPATALDAATAFLSSSSTCSELTNDDEDETAAAATGTDGDDAAPAGDNEDDADEQDGAGVGSDSGSDTSELEFNPFYFMKTLPKYEDIVSCPRPIALPAKSQHAPKISLVLDLDETLVHCSVDDVANPHLQFPVTFNGVEYTVKVKKRPHMEYFLKRVAELFEVVVFTASHRAYAETLLNLLDPHRRLIKYRLYRDDCLDVYGNYLKDLNVLGRDLSKVLLVDNSPHAFGYQVGNGVPIETWYDDEADDELLSLLPFLESLVDVDDVRPIVAKQFQIQKLIDAAPDDLV